MDQHDGYSNGLIKDGIWDHVITLKSACIVFEMKETSSVKTAKQKATFGAACL